MKIAIFADNFLPGIGGTENAVLYFAEKLSSDNQVVIFCPAYKKTFDDHSLPVRVVRIKSLAVTENDCMALPSSDKRLKKELEDFKPDVIHTETLGPAAKFAGKFAVKNKIPLVATVHAKYRFCYRRYIHLKGISELIVRHYAKTLKCADAVCTVSEDAVKEINSYGINKEITVIKNGGIRRIHSFLKEENKRFTLLFVGQIVKWKNLKFSLDALKKVDMAGYDFVFNIVGDGPDRKYFEKYVRKIGLMGKVCFLGTITDKKRMDEIYAEADLFLFPSIFDTDGLVVFEAGNMGTPSLVLENTGASERIADNVSGFIEKQNAEDYARRIILLMKDKDLVLKSGDAAKNLFSSWENNVNEYKKIYHLLLTKRGQLRGNSGKAQTWENR